jgi:excisionase family DNA binding protein
MARVAVTVDAEALYQAVWRDGPPLVVSEVAAVLRLSVGAVYLLIQRGQLQTLPAGVAKYLIPREAVRVILAGSPPAGNGTGAVDD